MWDTKSQAEDMDVDWKIHSIELRDSLPDCWSLLGHFESVYLEEVIAMHECETMTGVSTQEEANTLVIHHAVEIASNGLNVHIFPQDNGCAVFGSTKDTTSWRLFCGNHGHN